VQRLYDGEACDGLPPLRYKRLAVASILLHSQANMGFIMQINQTTNSKAIPQAGFLRLSQIVGNPKAEPPTPALIPVSKSTWWQGVKDGRFPKPVKLSARTTAWRVEDIRALIDHLATDQAA
jgi:prophage regulatory protein